MPRWSKLTTHFLFFSQRRKEKVAWWSKYTPHFLFFSQRRKFFHFSRKGAKTQRKSGLVVEVHSSLFIFLAKAQRRKEKVAWWSKYTPRFLFFSQRRKGAKKNFTFLLTAAVGIDASVASRYSIFNQEINLIES
ncbi:MAG: hypothetical protein IPP15_14270 [Saprospiraceae bacterium]|uniref:Uncharacterized protein n=1 Tax=Candidatus Opimibacter skivensis TaxID=2982028 RepID=A0A9D7XNM2_9BACT|nr:hypothetical protein [Candidatus Opimibacter skivensis]